MNERSSAVLETAEGFMTPEQFCYWLQGMLECKPDGCALSARETQVIKDHMALVFTKVTPDRGELTSEQEAAMRRIRRQKAFHDRIYSAGLRSQRYC